MAEKKQTGGTGKRAKSEKPAVLSGTVPEWSSTTVISQLLGKTVRRVQQLTQEGVLETEIPPGGGAANIEPAPRSSVMWHTSRRKPRKPAKTAGRRS